MPITSLNLDGPSTEDTIKSLEVRGENAVTVSATKEGDAARASVEVSHSTSRWSVATFIDYVKHQGFGGGFKSKIKLGK